MESILKRNTLRTKEGIADLITGIIISEKDEDTPERSAATRIIEALLDEGNLNIPPHDEVLSELLNAKCFICKKKIDNLSANPNLWGIGLEYEGENGMQRFYHRGCLIEIISNYETLTNK